MIASHAHLHSSTSEVRRRDGMLDRLGRATSGGGPSLRPAVVAVPTALRRQDHVTREALWRHARAADTLHVEEDRMRLVAALLVLGTLLVWILFLQG